MLVVSPRLPRLHSLWALPSAYTFSRAGEIFNRAGRLPLHMTRCIPFSSPEMISPMNQAYWPFSPRQTSMNCPLAGQVCIIRSRTDRHLAMLYRTSGLWYHRAIRAAAELRINTRAAAFCPRHFWYHRAIRAVAELRRFRHRARLHRTSGRLHHRTIRVAADRRCRLASTHRRHCWILHTAGSTEVAARADVTRPCETGCTKKSRSAGNRSMQFAHTTRLSGHGTYRRTLSLDGTHRIWVSCQVPAFPQNFPKLVGLGTPSAVHELH